MVPIYLDIEYRAKKIINKNIWYMFELLETNCIAWDYQEVLSDIFPRYLIETNLEQCIKIVKNLHSMVCDDFNRKNITPFYELALFNTISWWIDVASDIELDEIPKNICENKQGIDMYNYLNNINNYLDFMFQDWDFLSLEQIYSIYQQNPKILEEFLHIDIKHYIQLMPIDIQEELNKQIERRQDNMNKGNTTININGKQINIAKDNSTINALQNSQMNISELETIFEAIRRNLTGLNKEYVDEILDVLEQVNDEFNKEIPKKSRLKNYLKMISPMITVANGVPELVKNLQNLYNYIINFINNL